MEELGRGRPKGKPPDHGDGGAAVRSPSSSGDSSSDLNRPPSDAPTMIDTPGGAPNPFDSPTMVDLPADAGGDAPTMIDAPAKPAPRTRAGATHAGQPMLELGSVLAQRYEILQILGEGGMGAVYKAMDRELNRPVALKVIRPDLAGNKAIIDRFKQELLLAREVTHKNVIRIYDLGEAEGVKFITMEYVEGKDLRTLIHEQTKLAPAEAVEIMQQVCRALEAAHSVGIIHRDLKPQNIMRDKSGRILVMDFGLARTLEGDGMTQTGALVGTMDYMSPEQALGKELDQRSDVFALGLIFYELLTGKMPYKADSVVASLLKRTQERAAPVSSHDATIPQALSNIVGKSMEPDVKLRYQTAAEILNDLNAWQGKGAAATLHFPPVRPWGQDVPWHWIGGFGAVVIVVILGFLFRGALSGPSTKTATAPVVSLAILPFRNASGDPALDWLGPSLADMLTTDVGQSAHLRTISSDRLHQVLSDLRITPDTLVDPTMLRRIAEFSNADTVVSGQYAKLGDQVRIDAALRDLKHDRTVSLKSEAPTEKDLSAAVDRLADNIRQNLTLSPDIVKELQAQSFKPTSASLDALRDYNQGIELKRQGNNLEALKRFQAATKEDPGFAVAYSRLGETYSALGSDSEAEQASRRAMELSEKLPMAAKYMIEASHARIAKDTRKAIAAYENLAKSFPDDNDIQFALGGLYLDTGDFEKARAHYAKVLKVDPKNLEALIAAGWLEVRSGNAQAGLDPLNRALSLAIQVDNQEEKAQILQATGVAYEVMNKPDEALRNLQQSLDINRQLGKKAAVANSLVEIAHVENLLGKPDAALATFTEALKLERQIGVKKDAADTLIDMGVLFEERGQYDKALQNYKESLQTQRDVGDENNQAICLNNIGNVYLAQGKNDDALTYYQQALQLREKLNVPGDIADTLHNLGETYTKTAQYDSAMASYMRALDLRRKTGDAHGSALESHNIGMVFICQGRYGAAVNSLQEAVKGFHDLKDRTRTMAQILNDYAEALAQAGRGEEAGKSLEEAHGLARGLKNDNLMADILNTQGDLRFYRGDVKAAKDLYQQSLQTASRVKAGDKILVSKFNLAKVTVAEGQAQAALSNLRQIADQADTLGLKYLSVECSVYMAQTMINGKDYPRARQQLEQQLGTSEKLGLRMLTARIHYLLGTSARLSGDAGEAASQYRQAASLLDEMKKEPGAQDLLQRTDLKSIYDESSRWSQAAKS